jgi:hypothetical protein
MPGTIIPRSDRTKARADGYWRGPGFLSEGGPASSPAPVPSGGEARVTTTPAPEPHFGHFGGLAVTELVWPQRMHSKYSGIRFL